MKPTTSEWAEVRQSSIHNKGMFATKDIPVGTRIIEYVGEKITKKESEDRADEIYEASKQDPSKGAVYIFTLDNKTDIDGDVDYNSARFINHTCSPNCESEIEDDKVWIVATKPIKKDEELSYDYGYDLDEWYNHKCLCGKPNCVGYIVARRHWRALKKKIEKQKRKSKK